MIIRINPEVMSYMMSQFSCLFCLGTSAAVGIQIYATKCVTKPIVLAKQKSFQRNSVDIFRFASSTR